MTNLVRFAYVDVFAEHPLEGNPLVVVPEADDLSDDTLRAIAREFNQSETTFLVTPTKAEAEVRLRSFTPTGTEVLGAGHNALGAWLWLALRGGLDEKRTLFTQEIGAERSRVEVTRHGLTAVVTLEQSPATFGAVVADRAGLAEALGLTEQDLADGPAQVVSIGIAHVLVPLRDRSAVDRARPDLQALSEILLTVTEEGCYVYSLDPLHAASAAYTRFFNPTAGIPEDTATGTAAGPLAGRLIADGLARRDEEIVIEQGVALGRPSLLRVRVGSDTVRLTGGGLIVGEGTLFL